MSVTERNLTERLNSTNSEDFMPIEKCVAIIVAFYERGIIAFPFGEVDHGKNGEHPFDNIRLRLHKNGDINNYTLMDFTLIDSKLFIRTGLSPQDREFLDIFADLLGKKNSDYVIETISDNDLPKIKRSLVVFDLKKNNNEARN